MPPVSPDEAELEGVFTDLFAICAGRAGVRINVGFGRVSWHGESYIKLWLRLEEGDRPYKRKV